MATPKKKTNYVAAEIKKLEEYIKQIQNYLDNNPADEIKDRLDVRYSQNGNPIVKTIASKEAQLTCFSNHLAKLPALIEAVNKLRQLADNGENTPDQARGGRELPGIFKNKMLGNDKNTKHIDEDEKELMEKDEEDDNSLWDDMEEE